MRLLATLLLLTLASCGDDQAPRILQASLPGEVADGTGPFVITAVVTDDRGVQAVNLLMTHDLDVAYQSQPMPGSAEGAYQTSIGPFPPGSQRYLIVEATDADGNRSWYPDPGMSGETGCVISSGLCWHLFSVLE